jgi:signal transduction histidine kinase
MTLALRIAAARQGMVLALLSGTAHIVLFVLSVVSLALTFPGFGLFLLPAVVVPTRRLMDAQRRWAARYGVEIPSPYRPEPAGAPLGGWARFRWVVTDPATWRDLAWLVVGIPTGLVLGLIPAALVLYGLEGAVNLPFLLWLVLDWWGYGIFWPIDNAVEALLAVPQGVVILLIGLVAGPALMRVHAMFARLFLGPTRSAALAHQAAELSRRVERLTETRAEAVDAQAAELRRIERDLHDGAQARLVALSMNVGLAEELLRTDPEAAGRLLAEAREASGQALAELRSLVRGIHPPVLAERGLAGAIRALALAVPLPVELDLDGLTPTDPAASGGASGRAASGTGPGAPRFAAPVESAAYFAVAEALANVTKHSGARRAWIRLSHSDGVLAMSVGDDGVGGAGPARGRVSRPPRRPCGAMARR